MRTALVLGLLVFGGVRVLAQSSTTKEIEAAEQTFNVAREKGDKTAWSAMLHEHFIWTTNAGVVQNKQASVAALVGDKVYPKTEWYIRVAGDTAIASYATTRISAEGKPVPLRITHVWVKQGGEWKLLTHHGGPNTGATK